MGTIGNGARWVLRGRGGTAAALQTLLTRLLILAINMATGVITARTLAPMGRGEQAAMSMWPQFLAYAMTLGIPPALVYNFKRKPEEKSQLFSAALFLNIGLSIVAILIGVIFMPQWLANYSPAVVQYAQWFMLVAPLIFLQETFVAALEALSEFTFANQIRYLIPLTTLAILVGLALTQTLTPFTAALAYTFPNLPIFLWSLNKLSQRFEITWHGLGPYYKDILGYGVRVYGMDLLGTLAGQLDQVFVINLLDPASMGLYVVALSLSRVIGVLQNSIVTVLFPKAAARPLPEVVELTGRAARISTTVTLIAALGVIVFGPMALQLLYGSKFMGAIPVFRIFIIEVMISGTTWILAQAFMALGRPGTVTILQGIGLGLTVPLLFVLIPIFGVEGAGLAILCSSTVRFFLMLFSFPLVLKVPVPGFMMRREDWDFLQKLIQEKKADASQL